MKQEPLENLSNIEHGKSVPVIREQPKDKRDVKQRRRSLWDP